MDDEKQKSINEHDCTDCLHFGACFLIAHGRDPKDPCEHFRLEPWYGDDDD